MAHFIKRYHPPGTPPGTLRGPDAAAGRMHLTDFDAAEVRETELSEPEQARAALARASATWLHVQGPPDAERMRALGAVFDLHPLALEDVLNTGQRPKAETYEDRTFIALSLPARRDGRLVFEQVSLFLGPGFLLSFHAGPDDPFEPVRARLHERNGRLRAHGVDYLLYALLDLVIDQGFPLLEALGDDLELLEEEILNEPAPRTLQRMHVQRRELLLLRRMLWPQREVVNALLRDEASPLGAETRLHLRDCYDHALQIIELVESYREIAAGMLDLYLSNTSYRLNEIIRVLTVIATLFIPLTFIAGVYGMNFSHPDSPWAMPELHWYWGYPAVLLLMLGAALGMLAWFRRKRWL